MGAHGNPPLCTGNYIVESVAAERKRFPLGKITCTSVGPSKIPIWVRRQGRSTDRNVRPAFCTCDPRTVVTSENGLPKLRASSGYDDFWSGLLRRSTVPVDSCSESDVDFQDGERTTWALTLYPCRMRRHQRSHWFDLARPAEDVTKIHVLPLWMPMQSFHKHLLRCHTHSRAAFAKTCLPQI